MLLISVYCPTKNSPDTLDSFDDCFDQLYEIIQKFKNSHKIIIGGDFNEDIAKGLKSDRMNIVSNFMSDCELITQIKGPTFVNVYGQEVSELDYFMYREETRIKSMKKITDLATNVSDHYPVAMSFEADITHTNFTKQETVSKKFLWDKKVQVDKDQEKAQSEKDSHSKNRGGKKPN